MDENHMVGEEGGLPVVPFDDALYIAAQLRRLMTNVSEAITKASAPNVVPVCASVTDCGGPVYALSQNNTTRIG